MLWEKIESVLEERRDSDMKKQSGERKEDTEDGKIASINFGMSDYSFFEFYKKRAQYARDEKILLIKKNMLVASKNPDEKKIAKLDKQLDKVQTLRDKNEAKFDKFKNTKSQTPNAVAAFITMKSMEG